MANNKRGWTALMSQTGSEIYAVSKQLGRFPDTIIFNSLGHYAKKGLPLDINTNLLNECNDRMVMFPTRPGVEDYNHTLIDGDIITLHGWLNIIPPPICEGFEIYNGHPGLIISNQHPELKGINPQKRAWELKHQEVGCVLHKVISKVDDGEIIMHKKIHNNFKTEYELTKNLHDISIELWVDFLKDLQKRGDF
jgi:methionyl-tRNA formyltransferase